MQARGTRVPEGRCGRVVVLNRAVRSGLTEMPYEPSPEWDRSESCGYLEKERPAPGMKAYVRWHNIAASNINAK